MMKRVLACFLSFSLALAVTPVSAFAEESVLITEDHVTEEAAVDKTEDTTTYELSNGANMTVFHGEEVRFENDHGVLTDYNPGLVEIEDKKSQNGNDLERYAFENAEGDSKQYIPEELTENSPVLMEKNNLEMALSLSSDTISNLGLENETAKLQEEEIVDAYEQEKKSDINAVYGDAKKGTSEVSYTSLNKGIKENIVLGGVPESNVFTYKLRLKGCYPVKDELTGYITFYDEKTEDITGFIEPPHMNDDTGKAYSEDIELEIFKDEDAEVQQDSDTESAGDADEVLEESEVDEPNADISDNVNIDSTENTQDESLSSESDESASADEKAGNDSSSTLEGDMYTLVMTVSEEYLNSEDRVYPVTIDPTLQWSGNSKIRDAYVINGTYKNTNFYTSGNTIMPVGHGAEGDYRTYIQLIGLESIVKGKSISSATLDIYGTGQKGVASGQKVTLKRVGSSWSPSKIKWSKQPSISTAIGTITAGKTKNAKYTFNLTSFVKGIASGTANYGVVLTTGMSKPAYMSFIGCRNSSKYKPTLKVTYYSIPSAPSRVDFTEEASVTGKDVTVTYSGISSDGLKSVQYELKKWTDGAWKSHAKGTASSNTGSGTIHIDEELPEGTYMATVWGVNTVDASGLAKSSRQFIVDKTAPSIGKIYLQDSSGKNLGDTWTTEDKPVICFEGIKDNRGIDLSKNVSVYITKTSTRKTETNLVELKDFKTVDDSKDSHIYDGSYIAFSGSEKHAPGEYEIKLVVRDDAGNTAEKTAIYKYDNKDPSGSIHIWDTSNGQEISTLSGVVTVQAIIEDSGSDVDRTHITLHKKDAGEEDPGQNISAFITRSKNFEMDTAKYENGEYVLKMHLKNEIGREATISKDIIIANSLRAPLLKTKKEADGRTKITADFGSNSDRISKVQYKIDKDWVDTDGTSFYVGLEGMDEGIYKYQVKGVDKTGVDTKIAEVSITYDETSPEASIESFERGRLKGNVKDDNLKSWKIYIKENKENSSYVDTGISGKNNAKGTLGVLDYDALNIEEGKSYTIKLTATDKSGNETSDTLTFTATNEPAVKLENEAFRIKRPSYNRDYDSSKFILPSDAKSITTRKSDDVPSNVNWYIDNKNLVSGTPAEIDFAKYDDGNSHGIVAIYEVGDDYKYSSKIIRNDEIVKGEDINGLEVTPNNSFTSFTVVSDSENQINVVIDGKEASVKAGERIYVASLVNGSEAYANKLSLKSTSDKQRVSEILFDTIEPEYFEVSSLASYVPEKLTVKNRLNNRNYVYWNNKADGHEDISYNVYRSTEEDFEPSKDTLAAENVRAGYFCEINVGHDDFYYIVTAVRRENGEIAEESIPSKEVIGRSIDYDETLKRLGIADYWVYTKFDTPYGQGMVEKSQGNFVYTQNDIAFEGDNLVTAFTRTYNSRSSENGMFGYGWTSSFNLQLLNVYDEDEKDYSNLVFRDGTGTIYRFVKGEDGRYVSSQGEYIRLTEKTSSDEVKIKGEKITVDSSYLMETDDNISYRFNSGGQLVYMSEPNGSFLLFEYQKDTGLLEKVTNEKGIYITLKYNKDDPKENNLLVTEVDLPDSSSRLYSYDTHSDGTPVLIEVTEKGSGNGTITYKYDYTKSNHTELIKTYEGLHDDSQDAEEAKEAAETATDNTAENAPFERYVLNKIADAAGNAYTITYGDNSVTNSIEYPNNEGYDFIYGSNSTSNGDTTVRSFKKRTAFSEGETVSEAISYFEPVTGHCTKFVDDDGRTVSYEYTDGVCTKTSYEIESSTIDSNDNIVSNGVQPKEVTQKVGSRLQTKQIVNEDGSKEYYRYSSDEHERTNLPSTVELVDKSGNVLEKNTYEYNDKGDETYNYDSVTDTTTKYEYEDSGNIKSMREYKGKAANTLISETTYKTEYADGGGKTETETDIEDSVTTVTVTKYDVLGRMTSKVTTVDGEEDSKTEIKYDGLGKVKTETVTEDGTESVTTNKYTKTGQLDASTVVTTGKDGNVDTVTTAYTYDNVGRQTEVSVSDNGETITDKTRYTYEDVTVFDVKSGSKTYKNAFVTRTTEDGYITSETYTSTTGKVVREKKDGIYTDYVYDDYGTLIAKYVSGDEAYASNSYSNEAGQLTIYVIDSDGRITDTVTNPEKIGGSYKVGSDAVVNSANYDSAGRVSVGTDGNRKQTKYSYYDDGSLKSVTLPGGQTTTYEKNEGKVGGVFLTTVTTTDANGNKHKTVTDESGNIREVRDYANKDNEEKSIFTKYSYDSKGRLAREEEAKGNYKTYSYDRHGYIEHEEYHDETGAVKSKTDYTYNSLGNVMSRIDYEVSENGAEVRKESTYLTYDAHHRVKTSSTVLGNDTSEQAIEDNKVTYKYDKHGNVTEVRYAIKKNGISGLEYTYDNDKRLIKVNANGSLLGKTIREYTYDRFGRVETVKDLYDYTGAGKYILREYSYDLLGRISEMTYTRDSSKQSYESYTYAYDKIGNITQKISSNAYASNDASSSKIRNYTYDDNSRLTRAEISVGGKTVDINNKEVSNKEVHEYAYDAVGNRTRMVKDDAVTDYTFNAFDQLTEEKTKSENSLVSHKTYTYDANGNQIKSTDSVTGDIISMEYNEIDMMTGLKKMDDGKLTLEQNNVYNNQGQRIKKTDTKHAYNDNSEDKTDTAVRNYLYANGSLIGTSNEEGDLTSFNLLTPDGSVISTSRIGTDSKEKWYLYNKDDLGSTTSILGEDGKPVTTYEYDEYGNTTCLIGEDFDNEICYTGQIYDKDTGLYYYNARFYDPTSGIFTTQDTNRGEMNNPLTQNLYAYCAGNPVNNTDPTGHSWIRRYVRKVKSRISKSASKLKTGFSNAKKAASRKVKALKAGINAKKTKVLTKTNQIVKNTKTKISNKWAASKNGVKTAFKNVKKRVSSADTKITRVLAKSEMPRKLINAGLDGLDLVSYTLEATTGLARNMKNGASESKCISDLTTSAICTMASIKIAEYFGKVVATYAIGQVAEEAVLIPVLLAGTSPAGLIACGVGLIAGVVIGAYVDNILFSDERKKKASGIIQSVAKYTAKGEWINESTPSGNIYRQPPV